VKSVLLAIEDFSFISKADSCFSQLNNETVMQAAISTKTVWLVDAAHTLLQFQVKHLGSVCQGSFSRLSGVAETGDHYSDTTVAVQVDVDSLTTDLLPRDAHLKSEAFFHASQYPYIRFESTSFEKMDADLFTLRGNLTIRGTTRPVQFSVRYNGSVTDAQGNVRAAYEVHGTIRRRDFGLTWDAFTELGGTVVSNDVKISAQVQLIRS